jgi:PAS domain S-box-containing protein
MFVALRIGDLLDGVARELPNHLRLCLYDGDGSEPRRVLAGASNCASAVASGDLEQLSRIDFAGRRWALRIAADPARMPGGNEQSARLFATIGLVAAALLGALLLTVTGRTRRVERAVRERTLALEHEVDERTRTENALRESEQRLRNILDHAPIGVLYTDLRGHTQDSNPRFRDLTGYSAEELASMPALELTHLDDRAADIELAGKLARGEIPMYRRRKRYRRKDGGIVWVQSIVSLVRDADGRPHRIVGMVEDISEHLKLQQAEDARASAEAANRAKSDFLSRMSHELRTPLNAMLGFTQLLELDRETPLSDVQRGWTQQAQQAGWHLLHMIDDTLDLSRIEAGTLRLTLRSLELTPLIAAARSMIEPQARDRGITIDEQASSLVVRGDDTRVKQILTNLLSNAVKYNSADGRVEIRAHVVAGPSVEIAVTDTGAGLTAQQLAELFQPFNRLGRESSGIEGTGIGLVISRRLAELMGGSLRAHSEPGVGSTFVLALPLAIDIDPTAAARLDDTRPDLPRHRRRQVLYIEDNETNAEVMRGILQQRPQVELRIAGSAADAFAGLAAQLPDLILLDMNLPDMDGLELLRRLKTGAATAPIPVVAVSADATVDRIGESIAGGVERYLTKPVNVAELLGVVDEVLGALETRL